MLRFEILLSLESVRRSHSTASGTTLEGELMSFFAVIIAFAFIVKLCVRAIFAVNPRAVRILNRRIKCMHSSTNEN